MPGPHWRPALCGRRGPWAPGMDDAVGGMLMGVGWQYWVPRQCLSIPAAHVGRHLGSSSAAQGRGPRLGKLFGLDKLASSGCRAVGPPGSSPRLPTGPSTWQGARQGLAYRSGLWAAELSPRCLA